MSSMESEMIRSLVREALRDVAATQPGLLKPTSSVSAAAVVEPVSLTSDADVARFVQRVLDMSQDPETLAQLRSGRIVFTVSGTAPTSSSVTATSAHTSHAHAIVVEKGAVTESMVRKAAEAGAALHLGPRAVLTALAKDKARDMGVEVVKTLNNSKGTVSR